MHRLRFVQQETQIDACTPVPRPGEQRGLIARVVWGRIDDVRVRRHSLAKTQHSV